MSNGIEATRHDSTNEIEAILAESKRAHGALADLHSELEEQINVLDRLAFARGRKQKTPPVYEPGETAERKRLRELQSEVSDSIIVLAAVTATQLSDSEEVGRLRDRMQTVNAGLQDDLARLQRVEKFAETAAKVAASVEKAVADIGKHAAKIA